MINGKIINLDEDLTQVLEIRKKVFQEEQGISSHIENDQLDKVAIHALAYLDLEKKTPVATGRIIYDGEKCTLGRVAVLKEYRGKRYGDFIVRFLLNRAFITGIDDVYCSAQEDSVKFYKKIGFSKIGDQFMEAGIKHFPMKINKDELIFICQRK